MTYLNGDVISFRCELQPGAPAQSSSTAEHRAITDACNEVIWLRACLKAMGIAIEEPIYFREDNTASTSVSKNYMTTKRTKHADIKHHASN